LPGRLRCTSPNRLWCPASAAGHCAARLGPAQFRRAPGACRGNRPFGPGFQPSASQSTGKRLLRSIRHLLVSVCPRWSFPPRTPHNPLAPGPGPPALRCRQSCAHPDRPGPGCAFAKRVCSPFAGAGPSFPFVQICPRSAPETAGPFSRPPRRLYAVIRRRKPTAPAPGGFSGPLGNRPGAGLMPARVHKNQPRRGPRAGGPLWSPQKSPPVTKVPGPAACLPDLLKNPWFACKTVHASWTRVQKKSRACPRRVVPQCPHTKRP